MEDRPTCACGRTDVAVRDDNTGAPLCFACFKLLGDFIRWLLDEPRFAESMEEWRHLVP